MISNDEDNIDHNENEIKDYIDTYGELDFAENKFKNELKFKDRSINILDEQLLCSQDFSRNNFTNKSFFKNENILLVFLTSLFDKENSIRNKIPYIFIGDIQLRNKEPIKFISIDVNYFIQGLYGILKREHRENFYKFIYKNNVLNFDNTNVVIENINKEFNIFFNQNDNYISKAIYKYNEQTIKSNLITFSISDFKNLLKDSLLNEKYNELEKTIKGKIESKSFGKKVDSQKSDITLKKSMFFRKKLHEMDQMHFLNKPLKDEL